MLMPARKANLALAVVARDSRKGARHWDQRQGGGINREPMMIELTRGVSGRCTLSIDTARPKALLR